MAKEIFRVFIKTDTDERTEEKSQKIDRDGMNF